MFVWLQKYYDLDVEVTRKDGLILIREMASEVKNMMDIKMNAVMVRLFYTFLILYGGSFDNVLFHNSVYF
jgi:hypothetical protein